jgi:hypothetical protein
MMPGHSSSTTLESSSVRRAAGASASRTSSTRNCSIDAIDASGSASSTRAAPSATPSGQP